jgi:hypothetical protein
MTKRSFLFDKKILLALAEFFTFFAGPTFAKSRCKTIGQEDRMNKYLFEGLVCGGIFASVITWVAASDAIAVGGFALLASAVFGLAAGLCIGGLIAANFAMFAVEEKESKAAVAHRVAETRAAA